MSGNEGLIALAAALLWLVLLWAATQAALRWLARVLGDRDDDGRPDDPPQPPKGW